MSQRFVRDAIPNEGLSVIEPGVEAMCAPGGKEAIEIGGHVYNSGSTCNTHSVVESSKRAV